MPANNFIAGEIMQSEPCCLDLESGLFTSAHFRSVLAQELARLDRWEKPLGLVLLEFSGLSGDAWRDLSRLMQNSLRRIDLAARLGRDQVAVLMPDADLPKLRRWLHGFLTEMERVEGLSLAPMGHGKAVARPWEGLGADDLLGMALEDMGQDNLSNWESGEGDDSDGGTATAIAADERNLLFAGFKTLGTE